MDSAVVFPDSVGKSDRKTEVLVHPRVTDRSSETGRYWAPGRKKTVSAKSLKLRPFLHTSTSVPELETRWIGFVESPVFQGMANRLLV